MFNNKTLVWSFILFLVSFLMRFFLISMGPYHSDCFYLSLQAEEIVRTQQMHYLQSSGLPLTALSGAFFVWFFQMLQVNDAVFAVNFMSVVYSAMSVSVLYLCARKLFDHSTAVYSAIVFMFSPLFLGLSTFGNSHTVALFYLLMSVYCLLKYSENLKMRYLILFGLFIGCMGAARVQDLVVLLIPIGYLFLFKYPKKDVKFSVYLLIPTLVAAAVSLFAYIPKFLNTAGVGYESSVGSFFQTHFLNHFVPVSPIAYINILIHLIGTMSIFEIVFIVGGMILLFGKREYHLLVILCLWIVVPIIIFTHLKFFVFRFLLIVLVPFALLTGYCIRRVLMVNHILSKISIGILFVAVFVNLAGYYPVFAFRHQNELLVDYFKWIGEVTEENALIIERDHRIWISHYAKRKTYGPKKGKTRSTLEDLQVFKSDLDNKLEQGIPVYVTKYGLLDRKDLFRQFMMEHYRLDFYGSRMIEDWHTGCLKHVVVANDLLKINPKIK